MNPCATSRPASSSSQAGRDFSSWEEMEAAHTIERAKMVMKMYRAGLNNQPKDATNLAAINYRVAAKHELKPSDLLGRDRAKHICAARHEAWYYQHKAKHSMPKIGRFYGGRDHATVKNGIERHKAKLGEV